MSVNLCWNKIQTGLIVADKPGPFVQEVHREAVKLM